MVVVSNLLGASPCRSNRTSRLGVVSRFGDSRAEIWASPCILQAYAHGPSPPETPPSEQRRPRTGLDAGSVRNGESDIFPAFAPDAMRHAPKERQAPPASSRLPTHLNGFSRAHHSFFAPLPRLFPILSVAFLLAKKRRWPEAVSRPRRVPFPNELFIRTRRH